MSAPLDVLGTDLGLSPETARPVAEAVWFAWRDRTRRRAAAPLLGDIRNGVWWTDDGKKVVSLATGTGLHGFDEMDFETYVYRPDDARNLGTCCHESFEAAETCALVFFATGHWCHSWDDEA